MPRNRRLLVENGLYHVFNRGIGRKRIRFLQSHAKLFFYFLEKAVEKHHINILAYCLMENHYHLMIQTPNANLDKAMQLFGSGFSQAINREIGSDGPIFRSRYRSVLVTTEAYRIQLLKYIHLNPVESGLVAHPEEYSLSSFNSYLDISVRAAWLKTTTIMAEFVSSEAFIEFHTLKIDQKVKKFYAKKRLSASI